MGGVYAWAMNKKFKMAQCDEKKDTRVRLRNVRVISAFLHSHW